MNESILLSVKKCIGGIPAEHTQFDPDIIMDINTALSILSQLGIGPSKGFAISGPEEVWSDFIPSEDPRLNMAKGYIISKVRLLFDPPQSSALLESLKETVKEFEWRLIVAEDEVENDNS